MSINVLVIICLFCWFWLRIAAMFEPVGIWIRPAYCRLLSFRPDNNSTLINPDVSALVSIDWSSASEAPLRHAGSLPCRISCWAKKLGNCSTCILSFWVFWVIFGHPAADCSHWLVNGVVACGPGDCFKHFLAFLSILKYF